MRLVDEEQPPFRLRFHVARLYLDLPKEIDFSVSFADSRFRIRQVTTVPVTSSGETHASRSHKLQRHNQERIDPS